MRSSNNGLPSQVVIFIILFAIGLLYMAAQYLVIIIGVIAAAIGVVALIKWITEELGN